jgi:Bacterial PH domain
VSTGAVILTAAVTAVVTLLVVESYQTTPWLGDKLMQWSVRLRYSDNPERAKVRGEELISLLGDLPTLFKFPTAGWFFLRALAYRFGRGLGSTPTDRLLRFRVRRLRARRHWVVLFRVELQTVLIVISALVLSRLVIDVAENHWLLQSLLWYTAVAAVVRFAWYVLQWWVEILIVTDKELMIISGIIKKKTYKLPLTEVTGLSYLRPAAGRLLDYGTLQVEIGTAGQVERIEYLTESVSHAIAKLLHR